MNIAKSLLSSLATRIGLAALAFVALLTPSSLAATVAWGPAFVVDDPLDISKPAGSTLHAAIDFNSDAGFATAGGDDMINGIPFTHVIGPGHDLPGLLSTNFGNGPSYNATYYPNPTGDQDLDDLLDSHSYLAGNPTSVLLTLEGLTVGGLYQVQLINVADSRGCCATRTYEPDDGAGNYTTGVTMQRGLFQSTIGTFTADAATQAIQMRSLNNVAGNSDPGLSGIVVQLIPEPAGLAIVAFAAAGLLGARRMRRRRPTR